MALTIAFGSAQQASPGATTIASEQIDTATAPYHAAIVCVKHEGAATTITMADSEGSTGWTGLTKETHTNTDLHNQLFYVDLAGTDTLHTFTATFGASRGYRDIRVWLVGTGGAGLELDVEDQGEGNGTAVDAGSLTTTAAAVLVCGVAGYTGGQTFIQGSGWTEDNDSNSAYAMSRNEASSDTFDPTCTISTGSDWVAVAAAFKEASAASSIIPQGTGRGILRGIGRGIS